MRHSSETKIMNNIQSNIEYSRTSLLPLDFIFRKALRRYRISFLKVAMSKWFSFILRSRTIEKLLNKVVPYCISIQKIWRGVLGRKRKCIEQIYIAKESSNILFTFSSLPLPSLKQVPSLYVKSFLLKENKGNWGRSS